MAGNSISWFLVGSEWCEFYHEDKATGYIYPIALKNLNNAVGCSTGAVDAALRANADFFHYGRKSPDGKPASPYTFYIGESKYGLNPNNGNGVPAQISVWNNGTDYGRGGKYSASALHINMHARGLDPTIENTIAMLQAMTGARVYYADSLKKKLEIEGSVVEAAMAAGYAKPEFRRAESVPVREIKRGIHYGETAIKVYNENGRRIQEGIRAGEIEFPVRNEASGRITIPKLLLNIFSSRGITKPYRIPFEDLAGIGICYGENRHLKKSGIKLLRTGGEEYRYPLRGVIFLQDSARDDDGNVFFSAQIRNADYNYNLITRAKEKETGALRFTNGGPASPIGLERALNARPELGVFVFEGAFDRVALLSVAGGSVAAVATQGAKNHRYLLEKADRFRENGQTVVLAYDDDKTGADNNESLLKALRDKGVQAVRWCGCLGEKDFNDLLKNRPADAEALAGAMATMVCLIRAGYWTKERADSFVEKALGSSSRLCGTNLTGLDCADFIMHELRSFAGRGGRIQDACAALEEAGRWRVLQRAAEQERKEAKRPLTMEEAVRKNVEILRNAQKGGSLLIGAVQDRAFRDAYMAKGIDVTKLPAAVVRKLGYITRDGVYLVSTKTGKVSERPIFGLVAGYDEAGSAYRISEMMRIPDSGNRLTCTHEGGFEYTLGKPGVFGLAEAVSRDGRKTPVVVTENIYEALGIMSVSGGRVNAIAVDRGVMAPDSRFIDRVAESGCPIVLAAGRDEGGIRHFNEIGSAFHEKGCRFLYWPVCPAGGSVGGIMRDDLAAGNGRKLELLVKSIERLASMAETGRFTGAYTAMFVKAVTKGREVNEYSENASQYTYACTVLKALESEMNHVYSSAEEGKRSAAVEKSLEDSLKLFSKAFISREERGAVPHEQGNLSGAGTQSARAAAQPGRAQQALRLPETELQGMVYSVGPDCTFTGTAVNYIGTDTDGMPYNPGTSALRKTAKMANSASLAETYSRNAQDARILEVSSKSTEPLGIKLSAMNLNINISIPKGNEWQLTTMKVETLYQASKVFKDSGDHPEWYSLNGWEAKKAAAALHKKDQLAGFRLNGENYSLADGSMFYNWIYARAMCSTKNSELVKELKEGGWNAFTDIESRRGQYACQAEALAIYTALARSGRLGEAMKNMNAFKTAVNSLRRGNGNMISREQAQTLGIADTFGSK